MTIENFNRSLDFWIEALEQYDYQQLITKPAPNSWSVGQVYMHLLDDTSYYIEQILACVGNNDHAGDEATAAGMTMLLNNDFPDELLEGNPSHASMPQPESKEQLTKDLKNLRLEMNNAACLVSESILLGKAKHPGLGYFSAREWLQFADMHLRHHLRQKRRIDLFLKRG